MPFGLTIGTERATALQQSIQDELTKRGFSQDADPVMAEYITIMVINNKTAAQITTELEDLIGSEYDPSFTDWLFVEASKGATEVDEPQQIEPSTSELPPRDVPPHVSADAPRKQPLPPRNNVYQQALHQALPGSVPSGNKRLASARSPSPSHPNKSRRTDLPTGPRAMTRNEGGANSHANSKSLIDRIGGQNVPGRNGNAPNGYQHDEIQSRIDNIVNSSSEQSLMMGSGYPGMAGAGGLDMSTMAGMANPMVFQDILMNQMALMAQMTNMMNGGQFVGPGGFPMQGMPGDMGMYTGGMNNGFQGQMNSTEMNGRGRGRGGIRGGRGGGLNRGRGGSTTAAASSPTLKTLEPSPGSDSPASHAIPIVAPAPVTPAPSTVSTQPNPPVPQRLGYALPERPQSPTLCKFSIKCTNAQCRFAHPSPVATAESGVVLSNEACEKGKDCHDKDCIKGHVSPAVLNPQTLEQPIPASVPPTHAHVSPVPCRFGPASPLVTVPTPETGTMSGTTSHNKSVTFNKVVGPGQGVKEKLAQQMKEIEQRKLEVEKAVREAEAAAGKKDESKPVAIAA
ncbi:hypothetical protein C0992_009582 [Termitomyces sp. T32_za158]|nr:hypothetical protein C0992_009582 [Termitomyces sp. T32_za158]